MKGLESSGPIVVLESKDKYKGMYICSDGSCLSNPGKAEYRICDKNKKILYNSPVFFGTNNAAEYIGLVHALKIAKQYSLKEKVVVYCDSMTALYWLRNGVKNLEKLNYKSKGLTKAETMIRNCIGFVNEFQDSNIEVRKWETRLWGEIPADFGRK